MVAAARRASILSDIKNSSITMNFHGDTVSVEAESYDRGTLSEEFPAVVDGDDFRIVFAHKFVSDALKALDSEEIVLKVNQPATPAVFSGADRPDHYYLVMPIKLQDLRDSMDQTGDDSPRSRDDEDYQEEEQ
jgi:DNA polymerase-3 subunit beta